jgi:Carboxypeptidase regulatory-like domain/TonB dependent receptor
MKIRFISSVILLTLLCGTCFSQIDRAGLNGIVKDPAGRVLPGVSVTAIQEETGLKRETVTSAAGSYDIPELPIGTYAVTFVHDGFEPFTSGKLLQAVGQTRTLDVRLKVSGSSQKVVISDTGVEMNKTSDALGVRIEREQVQELPNNGRNWSTLTALVPGAVDTGGSNQRSIRFAGRGLDDNNFTYDGTDATNIVNQAQQPFVRLAIPTDSIQEFRVDSMLFTAENGSTPGGQVAVVSKAGSNRFHGNAFEFLRNDALDAREPIDNLNPTKPPFRLNQFGAALGGPIVHDRTFFYTTYEGLRQTWGQTLPGFVPSEAFRAEAGRQNPALVPILNAFPIGQIPVSSEESEFVGFGQQIDQENSGMVRLDQRFSAVDTAYMRFNFDSAVSSAPLAGGGSYLNDRQEVTSRPVNGNLEYLHIFSPSLVNEVKFGFNRGNVYTTNQSTLGLPYAVAISGFTTLNSNEYKIGVGNSYSWIDNLTWVKGGHTLKFGAEVRRIQLNQGNTANGTITFSSQASFEANQVSSASYAAVLPVNGLRKTMVSAFAQDEWKFRPNLTLNLGVRYSFYNRFYEVLDRAIPFDFATCGPQGFCPAGASFGNPNLLDIDPRISFAWTPAALGNRTVVRGGFGIYHGDGQLDDQNLPTSNEVKRYSLSAATIPNLSFPVDPFLATAPGIVSPRDMDRNRKDMYVSQWGLSIQQPLPERLVGTLSYVGSKGTDILTTSYINLLNPATGTRQYPGFGQVEWRGNTNGSSYQGLVAMLQRSFANGLLISANYVWSHEIDQDAAGGGDSDFPQNPACLACERASGDFDARHVFSANTVYQLPFGRGRSWGRSGVTNAIFGDWDLSNIVSARTGLPVNVTIDRSSSSVATGYTTNQRPDRVAGVSLRPPGGSAIHEWINPAAFAPVQGGGYGDAGRNLVRGPGLWQADLGLAKHIPLTEAVQLQFRTEFFNIFNRAQYGLPLADFSNYLSNPNQSNTFGEIISPVNTGPVGTGTPRQVQFMLRADF